MKKALVFLLFGLSSCAYQYPVSSHIPSNNKDYKVDYLFEHEGMKVYRFYDSGNYVYFTDKGEEVTAVKQDSTAQRIITIKR